MLVATTSRRPWTRLPHSTSCLSLLMTFSMRDSPASTVPSRSAPASAPATSPADRSASSVEVNNRMIAR